MRKLNVEEMDLVAGAGNHECSSKDCPEKGNNGWGNGEDNPPGHSADSTVGAKFTATGVNPAQSAAAFNNGDYPDNR